MPSFKLIRIVVAVAILATASCECNLLKEGRTTFILSEPNEEVTYDQANRICKAHGDMKPVSILTKEKNREVVVFLASYNLQSVWTSGDDLDVRSQYYWNGINQPFVYTNWLNGAPLDDESCRCVSFAYGSGSACPGNASKCAGWTVEPCGNRRRVLCEVASDC